MKLRDFIRGGLATGMTVGIGALWWNYRPQELEIDELSPPEDIIEYARQIDHDAGRITRRVFSILNAVENGQTEAERLLSLGGLESLTNYGRKNPELKRVVEIVLYKCETVFIQKSVHTGKLNKYREILQSETS